jgi:hypothetical protein
VQLEIEKKMSVDTGDGTNDPRDADRCTHL